MNKLILAVAVCLIVPMLAGCGSMFKGDKGDAGVALLKTYTGVLTGSAVQTISVPEIQGNPDSTYVMVYSSFPTSPTSWTPVADGWLDGEAMCYWVSWTKGQVVVYQGFAGNNYMIKVYENK